MSDRLFSGLSLVLVVFATVLLASICSHKAEAADPTAPESSKAALTDAQFHPPVSFELDVQRFFRRTDAMRGRVTESSEGKTDSSFRYSVSIRILTTTHSFVRRVGEDCRC